MDFLQKNVCAHSSAQHVNIFVYKMGLQEHDLRKCAKINYLMLTPAEWTRVGQFADLLSVRASLVCFNIHTNNLYACKYADIAQQVFLSDAGSTLHLAIPALETLHKSWLSHVGWPKYARFAPALNAAVHWRRLMSITRR